MATILFYIVQWLIFCSDIISATPLVGTIVRSAKNKEFSSVVAIGYKYFGPDLASEVFCTGTLITKRHVLTAAHCIELESKEDVQVFGGSIHIEECDRYDIKDWITYNDWTIEANIIPEFENNDIAIITLNRDTDEAKMKPALVSPEVNVKHVGLKVSIAGWGQLNNGSETAVLKTAPVKIIHKTECERRCSELVGCIASFEPFAMCSIAETRRCDLRFCRTEWATMSCGDSGGPLLYKNNLLLAINIGKCPTGIEPQESINYHIGLNYYIHFLNHLKKEGLTYLIIH